MRIHLGHHFYGAGNLGDDFMLAGFLAAMRALAPHTQFTSSVPFPLGPLQQRFPEIEWLPYTTELRAAAIRDCDAWLGLGGSPFQSAQSRWFVDHLLADAAFCQAHAKPMFYLGIGVQTTTELELPEVRQLCTQANAIWTRDAASAERLAALRSGALIEHGADMSHLLFQATPPARAAKGTVTLVANFDFGRWPGSNAALHAIDGLNPQRRVWLAQESRELPGAERALYAELPANEKAKWALASPDAGGPVAEVLPRWPSGEWLLTARYHAALAGTWSGSRVVVIATNEKLRAVAREFAVPAIEPDADEAAVARALAASAPARPPFVHAKRAHAACTAFARLLPSFGKT